MTIPKQEISFKDFPKVKGAPQPQTPCVWTVYVFNGALMARYHPAGRANQVMFDGKIENPDAFIEFIRSLEVPK